MNNLKFSIIIPVKPGFSTMATERLATVAYPSDCYEIIVAEGFSPSVQRNRAVEKASGDIVYFLDDDSLTNQDFLAIAAKHYFDPAVVAVGGPSLTPLSDSVLQRSIGIALGSLFGGGGARNRYRAIGNPRRTDDSELILCNLSFRRDIFLKFNALDERLYPNEENELLDRMKHAGASLIHDPKLAVYRSQRPTWQLLFRQFLNYGRGRTEQTVISKRIQLATLFPALFFAYIMLLPINANQITIFPIILYIWITFFFSLYCTICTGQLVIFPRLLAIFPIIHFSYGAGLWLGLRSLFRKKSKQTSEIKLKVVKSFTASLT